MRLRLKVIFRTCLWGVILILIAGCPDTSSVRQMTYPSSAVIIQRGVINCFEEGLKNNKDKTFFCEASAVVYDGNKLFIGNDKPMPELTRSAIFSVDYNASGETLTPDGYLKAPPFINARKYEDFAITPDNRYILAITGFDRVKDDTPKQDPYNTLLIWPVSQPDLVKVVASGTTDGVTSSVSLREKFSQALKNDRFPSGPPYYKVEGLAVIPNNKILFGVREAGVHFDDFNYVIKIIAADYKIVNDEMRLGEKFDLVYDFNPVQAITVVKHTVGLSGIAYDKFNKRLYLLTSFEESETDEGVGGFLWTIPLNNLNTNRPPRLLYNDSKLPLMFAHKAEGIAVIDKTHVFIIHDDDRIIGRPAVENPATQFSRKAHQAAYTIVRLN
jgi:hypothetical protein